MYTKKYAFGKEIMNHTFLPTQMPLVSETENMSKSYHKWEKTGLRTDTLSLNLDANLY